MIAFWIHGDRPTVLIEKSIMNSFPFNQKINNGSVRYEFTFIKY